MRASVAASAQAPEDVPQLESAEDSATADIDPPDPLDPQASLASENPRLTIPEVARIARKGTVPKPLLDIILDNAGWTKADAVRRALPPKHELKLIENGTAYGALVREAARKLLRTPP